MFELFHYCKRCFIEKPKRGQGSRRKTQGHNNFEYNLEYVKKYTSVHFFAPKLFLRSKILHLSHTSKYACEVAIWLGT